MGSSPVASPAIGILLPTAWALLVSVSYHIRTGTKAPTPITMDVLPAKMFTCNYNTIGFRYAFYQIFRV